MGRIKGAKEFDKFKKGERLTRKQSMTGKCFECNGQEESKADCEVDTCPMFAYRLYPKTGKARFIENPTVERHVPKTDTSQAEKAHFIEAPDVETPKETGRT